MLFLKTTKRINADTMNSTPSSPRGGEIALMFSRILAFAAKVLENGKIEKAKQVSRSVITLLSQQAANRASGCLITLHM